MGHSVMDSTRKEHIKAVSVIILKGLLLVSAGILLNILPSTLCTKLEIPLFLDCIGTILTTFTGGLIPGLVVGLCTNFIKAIGGNESSIYYSSLNVLIACAAALYAARGYRKRNIPWFILLLSFIGGIIGSGITWFIYGFATEGISAELAASIYEKVLTGSRLASQVSADFLIDLIDKTVTVLLVFVIYKYLLPKDLGEKVRTEGWRQTPLEPEERRIVTKTRVRSVSLRTKLMAVITAVLLVTAIAAIGIGYGLNRETILDTHAQIGESVAALASTTINPDMVDKYILGGDSVQGYTHTKEKLQEILDSSALIRYLYVYKIEDNGCRVVFDTDSEGVKGDETGKLIPFEDAFDERIEALKAGEEIPYVISKDSYGHLLTVYTPLKDRMGKTVCYVGVDITVQSLTDKTFAYMVKQVSLFTGIFVMVLAIGLWLADYNILMPLNSMAHATSGFAFNTRQARHRSLKRIRDLDIRTGDEIENLYYAIASTTEESMEYVTRIKEGSRKLEQMQSGLIMVLADMVESRDQKTGDHIKNTAAYVEIILEKLKDDRLYGEGLTEKYISDVVKAAPLHDIGKIKIPDAILNKPTRLTDEEYEIMKSHTTEGANIIRHAMELVSESGYLTIAEELAHYHHEKWDGSGYPEGRKGDEIPLSARVMAVADVFDALVAVRSYKTSMSVEEALSRINEGAGKHFDPIVAKAFLESEEQVRQVAQNHGTGQ